jgi:hypothetical protein
MRMFSPTYTFGVKHIHLVFSPTYILMVFSPSYSFGVFAHGVFSHSFAFPPIYSVGVSSTYSSGGPTYSCDVFSWYSPRESAFPPFKYGWASDDCNHLNHVITRSPTSKITVIMVHFSWSSVAGNISCCTTLILYVYCSQHGRSPPSSSDSITPGQSSSSNIKCLWLQLVIWFRKSIHNKNITWWLYFISSSDSAHAVDTQVLIAPDHF